ncbi:CASP-like protein 2A1 [Musa acuminata AAA Group]|uniref:CASP-like protein 2A1 n=1 Tax=Musa acuminata AAA Group TaxID=214697 RepID=UPI0031D531DD
MMSEEDKQQTKPAAVGEDAMAVDSAEEGRTAEALLRVAPVGLCLAAMAIMLRNSQENEFGAVSYADLTAFKYLVFANGVCAAYSLLSAFCVAMRRPSTLSRAWSVFLLDQVLTYVILAAGTVAAEIVYLAYMGAEKVTWSKECSAFDGFCRRATTSLGFTFGSVACYVLLSLVSSYRLFSNYETPITFLSSKGLEIAAYPC